ncbi:Conserved_hypothetical protein [Hexamita inflata]|uniref:Nudix hydrolase domain-containing protein n=1 Tax=Hexamita inflata TaxID=28002 RepID=A0AA86V4W8_9EUKA|nr:Conserved hypothetical protein [Hexamita inflata]
MTEQYRDPIIFKGLKIKAAGVLLYKVDDNGKIWILLRTTKNKGFSDLGGKNEPGVDRTPLDLAIRKCVSESCEIFEEEQLKQAIDPNFYDHIKESKYILYYAKIDDIDVNEMQSRDVEMQECHEYKWFPQDYNFIINKQDEEPNAQHIHFRLFNLKKFIQKIVQKERE